MTGVVAAKKAARMAEEDWPDGDAIRSAKVTEAQLLQPVPERVWAMRNAAGAPLHRPARASPRCSTVSALLTSPAPPDSVCVCDFARAVDRPPARPALSPVFHLS